MGTCSGTVSMLHFILWGSPIARVWPHHLRSQKCWGAVAAFEVLIAADDDFATAKITQSDVASRTHEHILWLEVTVNHLVVMQVVQGLHAICQVFIA